MNKRKYKKFVKKGRCKCYRKSIWQESIKIEFIGSLELLGIRSNGYDTGNANMQLPLFRLIPQMKNPGRYWYWLRNVASSTIFCGCSDTGISAHGGASTVRGVRPRY